MAKKIRKKKTTKKFSHLNILLLVGVISLAVFTYTFHQLSQSSRAQESLLAGNKKYKVGAYYFGVFTSKNGEYSRPQAWIDNIKIVYGRDNDVWGGVKDFYGAEPGIPKDTRGWEGDFSHLKPKIGYYDNASVETLEKHIDQATNNGLSYFSFYWYWDGDNNRELYNDGLDAFLQAQNRNKMEFMLSIVTTDYGNLFFTKEQEDAVIKKIIDKYFREPNYLTTSGGRPIIFILDSRGIRGKAADNTERINKTRLFIERLKQASKSTETGIGKNPVVLINSELGPLGTGVANVDGYSCTPFGGPLMEGSYQKYVDIAFNYYAQFPDKPFSPCITANFDERPRQDIMIADRKQIRYFRDFSFPLFRNVVQQTKRFVDLPKNNVQATQLQKELSHHITVYAWNEWHEGGIIEPNMRDGNRYMRIMNTEFGLTTVER